MEQSKINLPKMDLFLNQYKEKLQEALTFVLSMSQDEREEAMAYWHNVGVQISQMVHKTEIVYDNESEDAAYQPTCIEQASIANDLHYNDIEKFRCMSPNVPLHYNEQDIIGTTEAKHSQPDAYRMSIPKKAIYEQPLYDRTLNATQSFKSNPISEQVQPDVTAAYNDNPIVANLTDSKINCQVQSQVEVGAYTIQPLSEYRDINESNYVDSSVMNSVDNMIFYPSTKTTIHSDIPPTLQKIELDILAQPDNLLIESNYDTNTTLIDTRGRLFEQSHDDASYKFIPQHVAENQVINFAQQVQPVNQDDRFYCDQSYAHNNQTSPLDESHQNISNCLDIRQIKQEISDDSNKSKHTCPECPNKSFSTRGNLKRHMQSHSGEKRYHCEFPGCNSRFTEKKSLKVHERKHTGEKPHKCEYCNKAFSQTGVLKSHRAIHENEKPYQCTECDQYFRQKSQLKLHMDRHNNVKKLTCNYAECSARFLTRGDLDRHIRTHTGDRPYKCNLCDKSFTRMQTLNEHTNRHTGHKPYRCDQCDKTFYEMSACYKHKKSCGHG